MIRVVLLLTILGAVAQPAVAEPIHLPTRPIADPTPQEPTLEAQIEASLQRLSPECERLEARAFVTGAVAAGAASVAAALGGATLPLDDGATRLGLQITSIVLAGLGVGFGTFSTRAYNTFAERCDFAGRFAHEDDR